MSVENANGETDMTTYYHVASDRYQTGDDLLCWSRLADQGLVTDADWKWEDAEVGFDEDVVCLWESEAKAREFQAETNGRLLRIEIADDDTEIILTRVSEGFPAVLYSIPAYAITAI